MEKNENTITEFIKRQNQKNMKTTTTMFSSSKNADGEHPSSDSSEPGRSRVEDTSLVSNSIFFVKLGHF